MGTIVLIGGPTNVNSPLITPHTFGDDPIPLGTNIALIAGLLGQEFASASRHRDAYRDGVSS